MNVPSFKNELLWSRSRSASPAILAKYSFCCLSSSKTMRANSIPELTALLHARFKMHYHHMVTQRERPELSYLEVRVTTNERDGCPVGVPLIA